MAEKQKERRGLGRGLSALMADVAVQEPGNTDTPRKPETVIPIDRISPNPDQPRRAFASAALEELAASIREKGVIQPLIVRPDPAASGRYQIVAGERRWRAAQMAQLHELPAIVRHFDDTEVLEVAIIENIQRADLNAIEEAAGYRQLMDRFGHTQEKLAEALSKSRSHVANMMRLLGLPQDVQDLVAEGRLSAGHARALLTSDDPVGLARRAVKSGMSVRELERLVRAPKPKERERTRDGKDADTRALEADLKAALGMKVSIDHKGDSGGTVSVRYADLDQLDDLCRRLTAASGQLTD